MKYSPTRMREARKAAGFSRELAAVGASRSHASIVNYEIGRSAPGADTLARLAELYQVDISTFFVEHDDPI